MVEQHEPLSFFDRVPGGAGEAPPGLPASGRIFHSLDELARLDLVVLEQLYRNSHLPDPADLHGAHAGRLLGFRGPLAPLDRLLRPLAAQPWFPWKGKAFADFATDGEGINRLAFGRERRSFPFDVRVEASLLDGNPCLAIDYDRSDNPRLVRPVRDELRAIGEAGEGLYLGPSFWRGMSGRGARLLMFFGLSTRRLR